MVRLRGDRAHVFAQVVGTGHRLKSPLQIALGGDIRSNEPTDCRGFLSMRDRRKQDDDEDDAGNGTASNEYMRTRFYSSRSAAMGSTLAARRAGSNAAPRRATTAMRAAVPNRGVRRFYLKQQRGTKRPRANAAPRPATLPTAASTSD